MRGGGVGGGGGATSARRVLVIGTPSAFGFLMYGYMRNVFNVACIASAV